MASRYIELPGHESTARQPGESAPAQLTPEARVRLEKSARWSHGECCDKRRACPAPKPDETPEENSARVRATLRQHARAQEHYREAHGGCMGCAYLIKRAGESAQEATGSAGVAIIIRKHWKKAHPAEVAPAVSELARHYAPNPPRQPETAK